MKIKSIEITNVKGIANKKFELDLIPNKPHILVAPNGFGKSSFAIAFKSMNHRRMDLDKDNFRKGNGNLNPKITIKIDNGNGIETLTADPASNSLLKNIDICVINNRLFIKAAIYNLAGKTGSATLHVRPILLDKLQSKKNFDYKLSDQKQLFGENGKILTDISTLFSNENFIEDIIDNLCKFKNAKVRGDISDFIENVKKINDTVEQIKSYINLYLPKLKAVPFLEDFAAKIRKQQIQPLNEIDAFLAAIQIINLYAKDDEKFQSAASYLFYKNRKENYQKIIDAFYSGWSRVNLKEDAKKNCLIIEFPKAHHLSSGERDILSFVFSLEKARAKLKKENCILIIDEIFDYLDDANLAAFQYYLTNFIEKFESEQRNLFPLLLTQLNPSFFQHFCFNRHKIKVHYLDKRPDNKSQKMLKLLEKRNDPAIKENVSKFLFHYNPDNIDMTCGFVQLGIEKNWGLSENFIDFLNEEFEKFISNKDDYDPIAIGLAVGRKIECKIFQSLQNDSDKNTFLEKHHLTTDKLDYAHCLGIDIPQVYYLLRIIYNTLDCDCTCPDIVSPLAVKLENITIRNLIKML